MAVVVAACEVLATKHVPGTVYRASDYINALGSSPLIGVSPGSHEAFFLDMQSPFDEAHALTEDLAPQSVSLAAWPQDEPLDDKARAWLVSLGAEVVSPHGVAEAIQARARRSRCVALFYEKGDNTTSGMLSSHMERTGLQRAHSAPDAS